MTVSIDPSEVRGTGTSVKAPRAAITARLPVRALLVGGLGGAGLIAFSVAAFSFFSGLADPHVRSPRIMPVAAKMPDLKDGIPALASDDGAASIPPGSTYNLPRPAAADDRPAQSQAAAPEPALRDVSPRIAPEVAETRPERPEPSEAAGVRPERAAKPAPSIQNAPVVAAPPRTAALVPPARTETVKAKAGPSNALAPPPAEAAPQPAPAAQEPRKAKASAQPPAQKAAARSRPNPSKPQDEAPPVRQQAKVADAEDEDAIPGSRQVRAGLKAIGGLFGGSDAD